MNKADYEQFLKDHKVTTDEHIRPELLVNVKHVLKDTLAYSELKRESLNCLQKALAKHIKTRKLILWHVVAVTTALALNLITLKYNDAGNLPPLISSGLTLLGIVATALMVWTFIKLAMNGFASGYVTDSTFTKKTAPPQDMIDKVVGENKEALEALYVDFLYKNNHTLTTKIADGDSYFNILTGKDDFVDANQIRMMGGYETKEGFVMLFLTLMFNSDYTDIAISDYKYSLGFIV
jgi:hypothetical protein